MKTIIVAAAVLSSAAVSALAQDCTATLQQLANVDFAKAVPVRATANATFAELYAECDAKDSFAGRPLPKARRCSTDPNRVKRLLQFPDKTVVYDAKAAVDADGSPVSCGPNKSKTDQCETWLTYDSGSSRKFIDAEQVPFVVVPLDVAGVGISFMKATGIGRGDLAIAIRGDRCTFGVVGDAGPYFRLGEMSIAAHGELGNPQCAGPERPCQRLLGGGSGRGIASGVTYIVFPGTRPHPLTAENIVDEARKGGAAAVARFADAFAKPKQ